MLMFMLDWSFVNIRYVNTSVKISPEVPYKKEILSQRPSIDRILYNVSFYKTQVLEQFLTGLPCLSVVLQKEGQLG